MKFSGLIVEGMMMAVKLHDDGTSLHGGEYRMVYECDTEAEANDVAEAFRNRWVYVYMPSTKVYQSFKGKWLCVCKRMASCD